MEKSTRKQIVSGLRIGTSLGAFLIGGILMGNGFGRIFGERALQITWADWVGLSELVLAATILLLTAQVWWMLLGGYLLFGALKGFILFATGSFPSHGFSNRIEALALTFYCISTLALLYRFAHKPLAVLDRVALTAYLFCLWPGATNSVFSWWQGIGLGFLLAAWCVSRWRMARHPDCSANV